MAASAKTVAVVVPMSNRSDLTADEEISFKHLHFYLGKYDKFLIVPRGLRINLSGFGTAAFHNRFFGSAKAHTRLLFSPRFYRTFRDYKFILIYHPDALVFSDQLQYWCGLDFDFIGAPWIKHKEAPYAGHRAHEGKVGNGGFALIKVESFLKILSSRIYQIDPLRYWQLTQQQKSPWKKLLQLPRAVLKHSRMFNGVAWELRSTNTNDDAFWANRGAHYYPQFRIAPLQTALRFAFECVPRYCFELNNRTLPFGCHAWAKYDREFWEPYLLK